MNDKPIRTDVNRSMNESRNNDPRAAQSAERAETPHISIKERVATLRNEFLHAALPYVPEKDGWHHIWLSTTNQYDPIPRRIRMGYVLVKAEEVPDYPELTAYAQKSGAHEGLIACNEMLLAKIPYDLYAAYMKELHEDAPAQQAEALKRQIESLRGNQSLMGESVERDVGDGTQELLKRQAIRKNTKW